MKLKRKGAVATRAACQVRRFDYPAGLNSQHFAATSAGHAPGVSSGLGANAAEARRGCRWAAGELPARQPNGGSPGRPGGPAGSPWTPASTRSEPLPCRPLWTLDSIDAGVAH